MQGIDNAPDIVKVCYQSIKKWMPDRKIHVIDQNNLFEYVNLPDYIINKWKKEIISNTLFSDFIRLSVLTQFGGIWVDATVLMTGKLPDYIKNADFFMYQSNDYDVTKIGESWFIKANAHNRILQVATFGSEMSKAYNYSYVYVIYGLNKIRGLNTDFSAYVTDNYWPMLIGQFGFFIAVMYIIYYYRIFKNINTISKRTVEQRQVFLAMFITFMVGSLGSAYLTAVEGVIDFIYIGLFLNRNMAVKDAEV